MHYYIVKPNCSIKVLGQVLQLVVHLTEEPELLGLIGGPAHTFAEIDHETFSSYFPLPLIQEGSCQLLASMGTEYWRTS